MRLRVTEPFGPYAAGDEIAGLGMSEVTRGENHGKVVGIMVSDPPDGHAYEVVFPEPWPSGPRIGTA